MRRSALLLAALAACRDPTAEPELEPICGVDGPVKLLELADDEHAMTYEVSGTDDILAQIGTDAGQWRAIVVDDCGNHRTPVSPRFTAFWRWGDVLLGCRSRTGPPFDYDSIELVALSDYDDESPQPLATTCHGLDFGTQMFVHDGDQLLELRRDGSSVTTTVITDDIIELRRDADALFVARHDHTIDRYDPSTATWQPEVTTPVRQWWIDARWLVYQAPNDAPNALALTIRDRSLGTERLLADDLADDDMLWVSGSGDGVLIIGPPDPREPQHWFLLEEAREVISPPGTQILMLREDGNAWLTSSRVSPKPRDLLYWRRDESPSVVMTSEYFQLFRAGPGYALAFDGRYIGSSAEIVALDDDTGKAVLLGPLEDARSWTDYDDGRVLTVPDSGHADTEYGPLVLLDPHGPSPGGGRGIADLELRGEIGLALLRDEPLCDHLKKPKR